LWVNFTVTVFLAIGLGYGKARPGLMDEAPRPPDQRILPNRLFSYLVVIGLTMAVTTLAVIWWATDAHGEAIARTMGLTVFSLANVWFAIETSDPERSVFAGGLLENSSLMKGVGLALVATVLATELNLLHRILGTTSLDVDMWIVCIVASLLTLIVAEGAKFLRFNFERDATKSGLARPAPAAN
jgi:Ca2+-transporting ATPase